jgi:L-fucose isomerase
MTTVDICGFKVNKMRYKVGFLVFSESISREDVYQQRKPIQDREVEKFIGELSNDLEFVSTSFGEIRSKNDIRRAVEEIGTQNVTATILYIPIFTNPAYVSLTARLLNMPLILMGNISPDTMSQLGLLASGGAIDQVGINCKRIIGDISDKAMKVSLLRHLKAVSLSRSLTGLTFGCIGGRSLGISTGTADTAQWQKIFGIDIEHIDQFELVRRANMVSDDEVAKYKSWIESLYGKIVYKKGRLEDAQMDKMIRSYLATRSIIRDYELDFIGIKCQPELSNGYVLQCLNVQLINDPYDADGMKEPIVCSCEADCDGALTMQILKIVSGGKPTALQDIAYIDNHSMVLANCGSMASYFSALSDSPEENLKKVYLQPHDFGEAGGASTQFVAAANIYTYARLMRRDGKYWMAIIRGETEERSREALKKYSWYRPTSFVRIQINSQDFFSEYGSNHIHCVCGDYVDDLAAFCQYRSIPCKVY